jgi:hypothetical protein
MNSFKYIDTIFFFIKNKTRRVATAGHLRQISQLKNYKFALFNIIFWKFFPRLKKIEI